MENNKPKNIKPSNEKKYVDGPVDSDEAKYLSAIKDKETQLSLGEILKSILEIENSLNSLNSEHDFDVQLEELQEIKEKFKEFLEACKEYEDALSKTDNGTIIDNDTAEAIAKAEKNFWEKFDYLEEVINYLIEREKLFDTDNTASKVKETYKQRFKERK